MPPEVLPDPAMISDAAQLAEFGLVGGMGISICSWLLGSVVASLLRYLRGV